jgi:hypothetical protein
MIQRLYINNEIVDILPDTKITLNFKSNIFGEVSKITASNTQTVLLPKTTRNRRVLDNPAAPAYGAEGRYKRHACRYEQDGVELINGFAVVLDSADTYEIAIYWGIMAKYQAWVDTNPSLTDLAGRYSRMWDADNTSEMYTTVLGRGYGTAYYERGAHDMNLSNTHPSASCAWVLEQISAQQGITFTFPKRVQEELATLMLPCLTRNAGEVYWSEHKVKGTPKMNTTGLGLFGNAAYLQAINVYEGMDKVAEDVTIKEDFIGNVLQVECTQFYVMDAERARVEFTDFTAGRYTLESLFVVRAFTEDGSEVKEYTFPATVNGNNVAGFNITEEVDVADMDRVYFLVSNVVTSGASTWNAELFRYIPLVAEMTYPCSFDIIPNLPDISQLDFIKALCAMYSIFAMADKDNPDGISFLGIEDIMSRRDGAYDWTAHLMGVPGGDATEAKFSINDWAQKNWFRYAEEEGVSVDADATLNITNESLDRERDVITLPFAPSRGNTIIHYKEEEKDGTTEVELQDVKPRVMRLVNNGGKAWLRFTDLSWGDLLANNYARYADMLNKAVVIKEKLHISEYDIKGIDFSRPVYLGQYSRYFGIVSLQVTGRACTAELALLPTMRVDNHIDVKASPNGVYAVAQYPVASEVTVVGRYLRGASTWEESTFTISRGDSTSPVQGGGVSPLARMGTGNDVAQTNTGEVIPLFSKGEAVSLDKAQDDVYNYIAVHREPITLSREIAENNGERSLYVKASKAVGVTLTINVAVFLGGSTTPTYADVTMEQGATEAYIGTYIDSRADVNIVTVDHETDWEYKYIINNG